MTLAQIFNLEKVGDGHAERYESANLTLTHHGLEWEDFEAAASSIRSLPTLAEQLREWAKALEQDGGLATRKGIIDWMREVAAAYTGFPDPGSEPRDEPPLKGTGRGTTLASTCPLSCPSRRSTASGARTQWTCSLTSRYSFEWSRHPTTTSSAGWTTPTNTSTQCGPSRLWAHGQSYSKECSRSGSTDTATRTVVWGAGFPVVR